MTAKKKIGYAVIGLGSIAKSSVLPCFAHAKRAKLVALVSRDKNKARRLAKEFGAKYFYSSEELTACLANPEVDAIYLATPQGEHLATTVKAAAAGKHILCEKPLAATVAQAEEMVAACRRTGVQLMTAYRKYYEPSCVHLKKLIDDGAFGRIDVIHSAFSELHLAGTSLEWLINSRLAGGGPLMDLGVYCVNTSRWLVGEDPAEASAESWRIDAKRFHEVEEGITFRLRFPSGLVMQGSSSYGAALTSFLYVQGTKGWASLAPAFPFDEVRNLTGKISGKWFEKKFKVVDEFAPEVDAFAAAIQTGKPVAPDGVQGLLDMNILHAIYESAAHRAPVTIRYSSAKGNATA